MTLLTSVQQAVGHATPFPAVLDDLVAAAQPSVLRPLAFFVSWQGVLVLVYSGWSSPLRNLKQQINSSIAALPKEAPGAQWPKSSLAALKDNQRLTPQQLYALQAICARFSTAFAATPLPTAAAADDSLTSDSNGLPARFYQTYEPPKISQPLARQCAPAEQPVDGAADAVILESGGIKQQLNVQVVIDHLSFIMYDRRSLERTLSRKIMWLAASHTLDTSNPPPEELARVQAILAEPTDPSYWFHASRDGSREAHYRGHALGITLVHELAASMQPATSSTIESSIEMASALQHHGPQHSVLALLQVVQAFADAVEGELPGMYAFFDASSLHITVRGLLG